MCRSCQVLWLVTWVSAAIRSTVWVYDREIGKARQGPRLLLVPIAALHQSPAHTFLMLRAIHVSFIIDNPACTCNVYHTPYKEVSYSLALATGHGPWSVWGGAICKLAISFTSVRVRVHNTPGHAWPDWPVPFRPTLPWKNELLTHPLPTNHLQPSRFMSHSPLRSQTIYGNWEKAKLTSYGVEENCLHRAVN